MRNTTKAGNTDEQMISRMMQDLGWNVEIARVSKGHFDRICWKVQSGYPIDDLVFRRLIQVKRNGRPEKDFFTRLDPIYMSLPHERVWVTRWTKGKLKGMWTVWWAGLTGNSELRRQVFQLSGK